jgi:hypothetical protein
MLLCKYLIAKIKKTQFLCIKLQSLIFPQNWISYKIQWLHRVQYLLEAFGVSRKKDVSELCPSKDLLCD